MKNTSNFKTMTQNKTFDDMCDTINNYLINNVGDSEYTSILEDWNNLELDDNDGIRNLYLKVVNLQKNR